MACLFQAQRVYSCTLSPNQEVAVPLPIPVGWIDPHPVKHRKMRDKQQTIAAAAAASGKGRKKEGVVIYNFEEPVVADLIVPNVQKRSVKKRV